MIFLGLLISLYLGYATLRAVSQKNYFLSWELTLVLSLSLGLAASGLLTFFSLLIFGEFNRTLILLLNLLTILLLTLSAPRATFHINTKEYSFKNYSFIFFHILLWLVLYIILNELSRSQPYGQWDAWALWNMKTKFIIFGGKSWQNIFQLHWHTQPDYPLLLPMINSWLYAVSRAELHHISMTMANVFTLSTGFLLFAALKRTLPFLCALGAGLLLITNRFYLFMGTAQYADIVLTHYFLAAVVVIVYGIKERNPQAFLVTGLFLGILCFTKNEGITMATILLIILLLTQKLKLTKNLLIGLAITSWAPLIFKIFLAPVNRDISWDTLRMLPQLLSLERIGIIVEYFLKSVLDNYWHTIWIFILGVVILNFSRFRRTELKIFVWFFSIYLLIVGIVYLTTMNFDLLWRLSRTAPRVLFCVMPALLFLSLYAAWQHDDDPLDVKKNKGIMSEQ